MSDAIGNLNIKVGVDAAPAEYGLKYLANAMRHFVKAVDTAQPAGLKNTAADLKAAAVAADGLTQRLQKIATVAAKPITVPVRLAREGVEQAGIALKSWSKAVAMPITIPVRLVGMIAGEVKAAFGLKGGADGDTAGHLRAIGTAADRAKASVDGLGDKLKGLAGSALKGGVAGIAAGLTMGLGLAGLSGVGDFLGSSIDLAGKAEANAMAFEVMTGSAEKARDMIADIRTYAKESPFGTDGVTNATRGLLAMGLAADKTVPTVRMLGDVASASGDRAGETLDRLVLAYGQVFTKGRLMAQEMNQFTEAGVPLVDELARVLKKPKASIAGLVEAGQVGFREVALAFHRMTSAGGRFFGMTDKYGESFLGTVDRLQDGVSELKKEFGHALIEELGLKDAARDGEKFAADMKKLVADLRPAIRFVGDLGKGIAQVLGEGIRNAPLFAQAFGTALREASPELASYADRAQDLISDLQNFKLDPDKVIEFAVDIGVALAAAADELIQRLKDGLGGIYDRNVKPIVEELVKAASTWENIKETLSGALDFVESVGRKGHIDRLRAADKIPRQEKFLSDKLNADAYTPALDKVLQFSAYKRAEVARLPDGADKRAAADQVADLGRMIKDARELRRMMHVADFWEKFSDDMTEVKEARENIPKRDKESVRMLREDIVNAAKRLGMTGELKLNGVDLMADASAPQADSWAFAPTLRQEADKITSIIRALRWDRFADNLKTLSQKAMPFVGQVGGLAVDQMVANAKKASDSLKVLADEPVALANKPIPQLPPVIEVGTAEFARLAGEAMMPPMETAEDLLRQILGVNRDQLEATRAVAGGPVFVPNPSP